MPMLRATARMIGYKGRLEDANGRVVQECHHLHETAVEAKRCASRMRKEHVDEEVFW